MRTEDVKRFAELICALASTKSCEVDEAMLLGFEMGLDDLALKQIETAVRRALRECKYMPSPSELRELAGEQSPQDKAVLAFAVLGRERQRLGPYRSPDFDDPLLNGSVRALGGWIRVCDLPGEEFDKWFRKDFVTTYTSLVRTGVDGDLTAPLIGVCERENSRSGYDRREQVEVRTGLPWAAETPRRLQNQRTNKRPRLTLRTA